MWVVTFDPSVRTLSRTGGMRWLKLGTSRKGAYSIFSEVMHDTPINSVSFSSSGSWLDTGTGSLQPTVKLGGEDRARIELDGPRFIEGDSSVKIWNTRSGQFEASLDTSQATVRSVCFHPDDDLLLLVLDDRDRLCL